MRPIDIIRQKATVEEMDYPFLMGCLNDFASPRSVVTGLLRSDPLVRVKKGVYVFGPTYSRESYSLEVLANMLYGPSYISLNFALAFYGLIPEFVYEVTSVTCMKSKLFTTPVGRFSYTPIPMNLFVVGYTLTEVTGSRRVMMATPEKALTDLLYKRKENITEISDMEAVLFEDLRIEEDEISRFHLGTLRSIEKVYPNKTITTLIEVVKSRK